jgi:uncharacterized protein (DUF4415 family)
MSDLVRLSIDPKKRPQVSAEQKARLEAVASMPDQKIDYSDAPYRADAIWTKAAKKSPPALT